MNDAPISWDTSSEKSVGVVAKTTDVCALMKVTERTVHRKTFLCFVSQIDSVLILGR